jgi:hypothetical protein
LNSIPPDTFQYRFELNYNLLYYYEKSSHLAAKNYGCPKTAKLAWGPATKENKTFPVFTPTFQFTTNDIILSEFAVDTQIMDANPHLNTPAKHQTLTTLGSQCCR